ncbi:MAG TPA: hypothetical protein VK658_20715 [Chryseolinea sp.]|nr:hypothetical protein [Chryseolinea sp.]
MNLITILAVLLISLLFTIVFVVGLKSRGPWGSGWSFFSIVCLWLTAVSLWIPPAGPVWFGAPWIDLLLTGLLVSFVLSATSVLSTASVKRALQGDHPAGDDQLSASERETAAHDPLIYQKAKLRAGGFFWMLLLCLCALIIIGAS